MSELQPSDNVASTLSDIVTKTQQTANVVITSCASWELMQNVMFGL